MRKIAVRVIVIRRVEVNGRPSLGPHQDVLGDRVVPAKAQLRNIGLNLHRIRSEERREQRGQADPTGKQATQAGREASGAVAFLRYHSVFSFTVYAPCAI